MTRLPLKDIGQDKGVLPGQGMGVAADAITDCGPDGGCEECHVCRYLNFLEWVGSVGKPDGSVIQRNEPLEAYLRVAYPGIAL